MKRLLRIIGLQSPGGRLLFFICITVVIFVIPYEWLSHLSLWQALQIPSPSIGLTRAYWLFIHGDLPAAWERNKLIFLILAVGIPLLTRDILLVAKARLPFKARRTDKDSSDQANS